MTTQTERPAAPPSARPPGGFQGGGRPPGAFQGGGRPPGPGMSPRPPGGAPGGYRPQGADGRPGGGGGRPGGRPGGGQRRGRPRYYNRRKICGFCVDGIEYIDYKDVDRFRRYMTDRWKIESRRKTGVCSKHQRALAAAIKRARHLALIPFSPDHDGPPMRWFRDSAPPSGGRDGRGDGRPPYRGGGDRRGDGRPPYRGGGR